ncbi:MAG: sirohydrochlorin cobaltochelatase [Treponema sp.]|jgi:sirohydrochlorin cobaltochelatase|nr:sirohydrochlorin cobaltochelatase [Treponema sp.]
MSKEFRKTAAFLLLAAVVITTMTLCVSTNVVKGKPVILAVSFGTSFNDSREKTIGAIEKALAGAYPQYEVRRAFTSQIIIDRINQRDGEKIDNVQEAMTRLKKDGVQSVVVQPTHIMEGFEYDDLIKEIKPFEGDFKEIKYGLPLLNSDKDFNDVIDIITASTNQYADNDTTIVFMGHGTEHPANKAYSKLDEMLKARGFSHYYIGTVEATPSLDDIITVLGDAPVTRIVLEPLMIVAGDHANNDMAGSEDDSWKSILESKGYEVITILKGLGEEPGIQQMFIRHAGDAMK